MRSELNEEAVAKQLAEGRLTPEEVEQLRRMPNAKIEAAKVLDRTLDQIVSMSASAPHRIHKMVYDNVAAVLSGLILSLYGDTADPLFKMVYAAQEVGFAVAPKESAQVLAEQERQAG